MPNPRRPAPGAEPEGLEVLLSAQVIQERVTEMAAEITRDYRGRDLVLVCLLKGAVFFCADLCRAIALPLRLEFLRAASYGASTASSGEVRVREVDPVDLAGSDVLVVEDIVDSGLTLARILEHLERQGPRSLEVCTLLYKDRARDGGVDRPPRLRYIGFRIEDRFAVGYGLDHGERYRNLPYIAVL